MQGMKLIEHPSDSTGINVDDLSKPRLGTNYIAIYYNLIDSSVFEDS